MSPHDWLYRFGFPGFAEIEWVLPRDVEHDEPWYEPLPWSFACHDLDEWAIVPALADRLRELYWAAMGEPLVEPAGVPFHTLLSPLRTMFERGDLVAWVMRVHSVQRPALVPVGRPGRETNPTVRTMVFEVGVVDEVGSPIPGVALELQMTSGSTSVMTDGAGVARLDGTAETSATMRITNEDEVRNVLKQRWGVVRRKEWVLAASVSPETEVEVRHSEAFPRARAHSFPRGGSVERHTIILEPRVLQASLHGPWFDRHKSFVLPTALDGVRFAVRKAEENADAELLIVGHTDPARDAADGAVLSLDRARSVVAFLTADTAVWLGFYAEDRPEATRWGRREDELMIEAVAYEGAEEIPFGVSMVAWYRDQRGIDGDLEAMRPQLIAEYMAIRGTTLVRRAVKAHGCAGWFPLDPADLQAGRRNARLEMFLFENPLRGPNTESAILPAAPGDISPAGSLVRPEWLLRARRRFEHVVGPPPPWKCHVSVLARSNSGRVFLANRPFRLHSGDGRVLEGSTDGEGWLHGECVLPRDYFLEIDGVTTRVPAMPLEFSPRETRVPSYFIYATADER